MASFPAQVALAGTFVVAFSELLRVRSSTFKQRSRGARAPREPRSTDFRPLRNDRLLRAARGLVVDRAPVWIMRQAGRYLPEFREVRARSDFFTVCRTPALACEVTLQPLRRFPTLDACIIFCDILVVPQAMGMEVLMVPGRGPVFPNPLEFPRDVDSLVLEPDLEDTLGYVFDAINLTRHELKGEVPLIGFAGAPFTLMGYMIEGGGSKTLSKVKTWLYSYPDASHKLLSALTTFVIRFLVAQAKAGAQLLQVFESNGGDLSPKEWKRFCFPYLKRIAEGVKQECPDIPMTVFSRGSNWDGCLEALAAGTHYDVIGVDWTIDPAEARRRVPKKTLQGNLCPPCCTQTTKS